MKWTTKKRERYRRILGYIARLICCNSGVSVDNGFQCDAVPDIIVDDGCKLTIGKNVLIRRSVEIRATGCSEIVVGDNVRIDRGVRILAANNAVVKIGEKTRIGCYSVLNGGDSISIGSQSLVAAFVLIQTSMHRHSFGESIQEQGYYHAPVILKDDVWIGAHALVMPGCILDNGSIVGGNAVVTRDVAENNIVVGVPARILKKRSH